MTNNKQDYWQEDIHVNRVQYAYLMLQAKNKYAIMSRGTGKSFIVGAEVDENVRIMPRGITTVAQATIGQALTKTLRLLSRCLRCLDTSHTTTTRTRATMWSASVRLTRSLGLMSTLCSSIT